MPTLTEDLVEIQQLLARYAVTITQEDIDGLVKVFTPDGTYSAFGDTYGLDQFPELVAAAPKGLFLTGTALVDLDGDTAAGTQPLCFVDHASHDMRIGYYRDTYFRTENGWRLKTRAMTLKDPAMIRIVMIAPARSAHTAVGPRFRRCIPAPIATTSAVMFNKFAAMRAATRTHSTARHLGNLRTASSPSPRPVASAVRSHVSWTAAISGNVKRLVHNSPKRNCAPACAYVAIPDGSSSDAPVTNPGPSARRYPRQPGGDPA